MIQSPSYCDKLELPQAKYPHGESTGSECSPQADLAHQLYSWSGPEPIMPDLKIRSWVMVQLSQGPQSQSSQLHSRCSYLHCNSSHPEATFSSPEKLLYIPDKIQLTSEAHIFYLFFIQHRSLSTKGALDVRLLWEIGLLSE